MHGKTGIKQFSEFTDIFNNNITVKKGVVI